MGCLVSSNPSSGVVFFSLLCQPSNTPSGISASFNGLEVQCVSVVVTLVEGEKVSQKANCHKIVTVYKLRINNCGLFCRGLQFVTLSDFHCNIFETEHQMVLTKGKSDLEDKGGGELLMLPC